ncbi:cytochrome c oxidoreductase like protein [Arabidopsis thaliana]|nr:cytochrome c oxidoreductase like protein [Arabidopsis thaliana]CAB78634.1 cytochrome c oxidoreductase like protein [Arabidopsis thaliana]
MAEASFYIGVIGNVISVLVFLSPVLLIDRSILIYQTKIIRETFWKIVKRRSTEEYKSLPYICTLLGSSLWTYYGIVTPGEYLVSTVNGFGALVETIYVSLFLFYAPRHLKLKTVDVDAMLNVFFPIAAIVATRSAFEDEKMRSQSIGFISAGLNIIMYGSPLSAMLLYCTTTWYGRSISWIKTYIRNISFSIIRNKINRIRFEFITISVIIYRLIIVSNFLIQYAENSSDNKEREIHAVLVVVFPLLKRRDLGCLCFTPTRRFLTRKNAKPVGLSNGLSEIAQDEEEGLTSRVEPLLS